MNCHGHNKKNHISHMLMMIVCCGAPFIIFLLLPWLSRIGGSVVAKPLSVIAPFICPIMMVFMIPVMLKQNKQKD